MGPPGSFGGCSWLARTSSLRPPAALASTSSSWRDTCLCVTLPAWSLSLPCSHRVFCRLWSPPSSQACLLFCYFLLASFALLPPHGLCPCPSSLISKPAPPLGQLRGPHVGPAHAVGVCFPELGRGWKDGRRSMSLSTDVVLRTVSYSHYPVVVFSCLRDKKPLKLRGDKII